MKYLKIYQNDKLVDVTQRSSSYVIDQILADNSLERIPNVGQVWYDYTSKVANASLEKVSPQRKINILNKFIDNSDIFEKASLSSERDWRVLDKINTFPDYLYVSDMLQDSIPDSLDVIGNGESVSSEVYQAVIQSLMSTESIDPAIFSMYSSMINFGVLPSNTKTVNQTSPFASFNIPQGEVLLYSSISNDYVQIPAFPEEIQDSRSANYVTMPDLIYQYEPWQMYMSSGPRTNTYEFHLHRDMWTGDHNDGKANELVRFCEAQLYPRFYGSAVVPPLVSLYVSGSELITGIMTQVEPRWSGPLGHDGWYLELTLSLTITEVSKQTLDYDTILSKPLIG